VDTLGIFMDGDFRALENDASLFEGSILVWYPPNEVPMPFSAVRFEVGCGCHLSATKSDDVRPDVRPEVRLNEGRLRGFQPDIALYY
jgi:hypothetical protein